MNKTMNVSLAKKAASVLAIGSLLLAGCAKQAAQPSPTPAPTLSAEEMCYLGYSSGNAPVEYTRFECAGENPVVIERGSPDQIYTKTVFDGKKNSHSSEMLVNLAQCKNRESPEIYINDLSLEDFVAGELNVPVSIEIRAGNPSDSAKFDGVRLVTAQEADFLNNGVFDMAYALSSIPDNTLSLIYNNEGAISKIAGKFTGYFNRDIVQKADQSYSAFCGDSGY